MLSASLSRTFVCLSRYLSTLSYRPSLLRVLSTLFTFPFDCSYIRYALWVLGWGRRFKCLFFFLSSLVSIFFRVSFFFFFHYRICRFLTSPHIVSSFLFFVFFSLICIFLFFPILLFIVLFFTYLFLALTFIIFSFLRCFCPLFPLFISSSRFFPIPQFSVYSVSLYPFTSLSLISSLLSSIKDVKRKKRLVSKVFRYSFSWGSELYSL